MSASVAEIQLPELTGPQMRIWGIDEQPERCWDVEGSPRSAKSWGTAFWIWKLVFRYPGIQIFYCRYKDDDLKTLRDVWAKVSVYFPQYMQPQWNAKEEAWDFPNGEWKGDVYSGSRVYLSSLRVAEAMTDDAVHGKYKGKTLAVIVCEEAQEIPQVNYHGLKERLSQGKTPFGVPFRYPLKIVMVHNAVDEDHYLCTEFPLVGDDCTREGHAHIRADLYSNAVNLGPEVMMGYEQDYPPSHTLRRTVIEGRRGPTQVGKPVYGDVFDRATHVSAQLKMHPAYPILEGWDFGEEKPCVSWWQWLQHLGALRLLGAVKGTNIFLEQFAPRVMDIRGRLFPGIPHTEFWTWCDPTGATGNQGMEHTAIRHLQGLDIAARYDPSSNQAHVRYGAIQVIAGYLIRVAQDGSPALQMVPHITELVRESGEFVERKSDLHIAAFQTGYVWDDHAPPQGQPNVRRPKKGTRYDDFMNCSEYIVIGERISVPQHAEMWAADRRVAAAMERVAAATIASTKRVVGPTGETMAEAELRLMRERARFKDVDRRDRRQPVVGGRGGY